MVFLRIYEHHAIILPDNLTALALVGAIFLAAATALMFSLVRGRCVQPKEAFSRAIAYTRPCLRCHPHLFVYPQMR